MNRPCRYVVALSLLAACEAGGTSAPSVRPLLRPAEPPEFQRPGGVFQGDSVVFYRVMDGALLGNGDAVVILGGDQNKVVYLDSDGQIELVVGGRGGGPEEFVSVPSIAHRDGETFFLWDSNGRRLSEFKGRERVGPPTSIRPVPGHRLAGVLPDGSVVTAPGREPDPNYHIWSGASVDTISGPAARPSALTLDIPGGTSVLDPRPCLLASRAVVFNSQIIVVDNWDGVIVSMNRSGVQDTIFQSNARAQVTAEMAAAARTNAAGSAGPSRERFLALVGIEGAPLPSAWGEVRWNGRELWLRRSSPCFESMETPRSHTWDIVDVANGSHSAATLPSTYRLLDVEGNRALVVVMDEQRVELVGVYRIHR